MFRIICAVLVFFAFSGSALAKIAGSDDPRFQKAVELWLQDNDKDSLPLLSELAYEGNKASRFLLAQIERTTHFTAYSPFRNSLTRKERARLFRAPGGLNGTSWLHVMDDEGDEFASFLTSFNDPRLEFEQIQKLHQTGEDGLTRRQIARLIDSGDLRLLWQLKNANLLIEGEIAYYWFWVFAHPNAPKDLVEHTVQEISSEIKAGALKGKFAKLDVPLILTWRPKHFTIHNKQGERNKTYSEHLASPYKLALKYNNSDPQHLKNYGIWLAKNYYEKRFLEIPKLVCSRICPNKTYRCLTDLVTFAEGHNITAEFTSPLEKLISAERYKSSLRAQNSLLHRVRWTKDEYYVKNSKLESCVSEALTKLPNND